MTGLPINKVQKAAYVSWPGIVHPPATPGGDQTIEVLEFYSGILLIEKSASSISNETFKTFIPTDSSRKLRRYLPDLMAIEMSAFVSPTTFWAKGDDEDHGCVINATVRDIKAQPNEFPGIGGNPDVLVLTIDTTVLRGILTAVSYHVVVKSLTLTKPTPIGQDPETGQPITIPGPDLQEIGPIPSNSEPD